jgi:hypothetical protein
LAEDLSDEVAQTNLKSGLKPQMAADKNLEEA